MKIDFLKGPLLKNVFLFAVPIAMAGMLQQLFNFADTAVAGRFSGSAALAAVGTNGEIVALLVSLSAGLSAGINVVIAAGIGRGEKKILPDLIRTAWILSAAAGIILMAVTIAVSEPVLARIHTPEDAYEGAVLYLRLYAPGCPFLMLYDGGSAILRARGDSRRPLFAMIISGIVNVGLNLFFAAVCHAGVGGVALATSLSNILSAALVIRWVRQDSSKERNPDKTGKEVSVCVSLNPAFQRKTALFMLKIGIPAAVQGAVFCFANIFVQSAVNSFGSTVTAGAAAAMNFEYLTYYWITAFGQTAAAFTGQNYAAGNLERCRKIGKYCLLLSAFLCGCMTVSLVLFRTQAAGLFSSDPDVIQAAALRMGIILLFEPLCACYESLSGVLRGMGDSLTPAVETILGTCALRIIWIWTVFAAAGTQESLYTAFPVSWVITSLTVFITCRRRMMRESSRHADSWMNSNKITHAAKEDAV